MINYANKNVKFIDWKVNIKKYFLKSDLFILPSYYEGLPNALIEAVYYNLPSIATDCSGARDILVGTKGGYIVPINDLNQLKKKISQVILNYKDALKKSSIAKKKVTRFSVLNCKYYYELINKETHKAK